MDGITSLFSCCLSKTNAKNIYKKRSEITTPFTENHNKITSFENLKNYIYQPSQNGKSIEFRQHKFVLERMLEITVACIDNKGSLPTDFYSSKKYELIPKNIKDEIEYLCCNENSYIQRDITRSAAKLLDEICTRLYYIEHSAFMLVDEDPNDFSKTYSSRNFKDKIQTITNVLKDACPNNQVIVPKINKIRKNYLDICKKSDSNNLNNIHAAANLATNTTDYVRQDWPLLNESLLEELCNFPVELIFNKIKPLFPDFNPIVEKQPKYTFLTEKHRTNSVNNHTLVNPHDLKNLFNVVSLVLYEPPATSETNQNNFLKIFYKDEKAPLNNQIKTLLILSSRMIDPKENILSTQGKKIIEDYCDTIYDLSHTINPTDEIKSDTGFLVSQNGKLKFKYPVHTNQPCGKFIPPTFNYEDVLITREDIPDIWDKDEMHKFLDALDNDFKTFGIRSKKEQLDEEWNKLGLPSSYTSNNANSLVIDNRIIQIILKLATKWAKDSNGGKIDINFDYHEKTPQTSEIDIIKFLEDSSHRDDKKPHFYEKFLVYQFLRAHKHLIQLPQILDADFDFMSHPPTQLY